jgi:hypothetical protein
MCTRGCPMWYSVHGPFRCACYRVARLPTVVSEDIG